MTTPVNAAAANSVSGKANMPGGNLATAGDTGAGDLFASLLGLQMSALGSSFLPGANADPLADAGLDKDKPAKGDDGQTPTAPLPGMPLMAAAQQPLQQQAVTAPRVNNDLPAGAKPVELKPDIASALPAAISKARNPSLPAQQNLPEDGKVLPQFLPLQGHEQLAAKPTTPTPVFTVQQPVTDPNWAKAMSEQVMGMVSLKADKAQIQLNPPQLGPIEVTLKMNGNDQAQVLFAAAVPATREALENNMHRLSSMLAAGGIQLTDAQVSSGQSGQQQQAFQRGQSQRQNESAEPEPMDALSSIKAARGILSIFA
ncbi:flagellar hook-length control protein FliK [Chromobacterium alkanivorans]|uniref:flagellar hook-length control protein FliK n=1 Tax=Chromobacterium alkanivorans TaxID=1071719 RepID=UPI0019678E35|nr:flagellar hook-length control protein FliK [Chromobacterium alkanivorans]MBN3003223.1 flagellar hook-length control protein FliK [Chromobacterium alkanivorans]